LRLRVRSAGTGFDDTALAARQAQSQRGFYRALSGGSPQAQLIELEGVQATAIPARPWFSIFSSAFYSNRNSLEAALPTLGREYAKAGVMAWSVWVTPDHKPINSLLERAGFVCAATPLRMAASIGEIDLELRMELDLVSDPSWEMVARCNDRAHGVPEDWTMAAVFQSMDDAPSSLHAARADGDVVAALIAREQDGDCYLWFVATVPEAQRKGIGAELVRRALIDARGRGCQTTSLESTAAGERLYAKLGYRSLGRYPRWEQRVVE
jgi:ribosomal protein S18 acetylase RimI-like enzyme